MKCNRQHIALSKHFVLVPILAVLFFASSCKSKKNTDGTTKLKNKPSKELVQLLTDNELDAKWLNSKASINIGFRGEEYALKSNLRMRVDSATWISLSKVTVPVIKSLISTDSVKVLFRFGKKEYYVNHFDSINAILRTELDYNLLEDFFLGNPIAFGKTEEFRSDIDGQRYVLSSHNSKRIERMLEKGKAIDTELLYTCWIHPKHFKATRVVVDLLSKETKLDVRYDDFTTIDGQIFPMKASMLVTSPNDTILMDMNYSSITLNEPQRMPFKITSSYSPIVISGDHE